MKTTRRLVPMACGAMLALGALAGCGSDDGGSDSDSASGDSDGADYCTQVEDMKSEIGALAGSDSSIDDMRSAVDRIEAVVDVAPSDVGSEWDSLYSAADEMVTKLEDSDIPSDEPFGDAAQQAVKDDKDLATELQDAMSAMQDVSADADTISKQVKDECDIDLSSS